MIGDFSVISFCILCCSLYFHFQPKILKQVSEITLIHLSACQYLSTRIHLLI